MNDPIKRHIARRLVRQRVKIHEGLEHVLTTNSAQILQEFLQGAAISIVRITAKRPRQTQRIYYNVTSAHDPKWVQERLDILAPKLRSQLATRVNFGKTPKIRFVPHRETQAQKRAQLWKHARKILAEETPGGGSYRAHAPLKAPRWEAIRHIGRARPSRNR
eukprot:NODE_12901_length_1197_cov_4.269159.p2 GENE.NODE_12901_length_1197_cov_4.269159~~NODE_12901_length_1197_cov_4.269159.p2  ORF type:complete len:162 (-),score=46.32 NODE_12901_length_1197_cov_4.269159:283-768(-)